MKSEVKCYNDLNSFWRTADDDNKLFACVGTVNKLFNLKRRKKATFVFSDEKPEDHHDTVEFVIDSDSIILLMDAVLPEGHTDDDGTLYVMSALYRTLETLGLTRGDTAWGWVEVRA